MNLQLFYKFNIKIKKKIIKINLPLNPNEMNPTATKIH